MASAVAACMCVVQLLFMALLPILLLFAGCPECCNHWLGHTPTPPNKDTDKELRTQ